jgi:AmiR/NasT family two-component response regulator
MESKTVMVVEDEPIIGLEIRETLKRLGYNVPEVISTGEDVLQAVVRHKPDLLLMDIRLGGFQDGIETAYLIGAEFGLPIVYLSAYSNDESIMRAAKTHAYGYLVKPFDERTLRTTIELAFMRSREDKRHLVSEAEARFGTILDEMDSPIYVVDMMGKLVYANPQGAKFLDKAPGEDCEGFMLYLALGSQAPWALGEAMSATDAVIPFSRSGKSFSSSWTPLWGDNSAFKGAMVRIAAEAAGAAETEKGGI